MIERGLTEKIINSVLDMPSASKTYKRKCVRGNFGEAVGAEFRLERSET